MLIQYCSDLHLEFAANRAHLAGKPLVPRGRILLLAGDIVPFASMNAHDAFFDQLSANFRKIYWIPGNHEYYGSDARFRSGSYQENIRENLILTNNSVVEEDGVRIILSTLWSHISPRHEWEIEKSLNDFGIIDYGHRALRAADVNQLHAESLEFIRTELARPSEKKTIVVTHHTPTLFHYPEVYKSSILNEAFAVELFPLIQESPIDYWIYGHHHFNTPDFTIGKTTLTTNQLGYVERRENRGFSPEKFIEL
jgi:DNA repair exonuclease SbcCD nuclease subunit